MPVARWRIWPRFRRLRPAGRRSTQLQLADEIVPDHLHEFDRGHQGVLRRARRAGVHFFQCRAAFEWAFARGKRILFLPDQHLGRNTGFAMGIPLEQMAVWDPWGLQGGQIGSRASPTAAFCCGRGTARCISAFCPATWTRFAPSIPGIQVIVHPECRWEVCQKADALGSTERLIKIVEEAPTGTTFAIGTEIHLVNRLARRFARGGQAHHHSRRSWLPVHDHVSHQPAASGVGAGKPGRRPGCEPDQGARRREALGARCAGSHA